MSADNAKYSKFDFDEYARSCSPDDFLGQTRRTVNGVPVSEEQIAMIIDKIQVGLQIKSHDKLLDIGCGNGALSHYLFDSCASYFGIDLSEYLISVAKANFEIEPHHRFAHYGAVEYLRINSESEKYSKVLCYGSFQYLSTESASEVLGALFHKFNNVEMVLLGNLPDKDRAASFYKNTFPSIEELLDCHSQLGIWRTQDEITQLANESGWQVRFSNMPTAFHGSHYRFDAVLSR